MVVVMSVVMVGGWSLAGGGRKVSDSLPALFSVWDADGEEVGVGGRWRGEKALPWRGSNTRGTKGLY